MKSNLASPLLVLSIVVLAAAAIGSCGSVSGPADGGASGAAGTGAGGTTGTAGTSGGGTTGTGGAGGAPLTCRTDMNDCPTGFTCACGGPGPGVCTCHRNCTDVSQCPAAEPMCGCPGSTTGPARFCVNGCFCNCQ